MRVLPTAALVAGLMAVSCAPALAADGDTPGLYPDAAHPWRLAFDGRQPEPIAVHADRLPAFAPLPAALPSAVRFEASEAVQGAPPPKAYVYSEGYEFRNKIHKYASWATIPLFASQAIVGAKLYDGSGDSGLKDLHGVLAGLTGGLFAINTVTGVWNLVEGWDNPTGRTKRLIHGLLMLGADAAFLATYSTAPEAEHGSLSGDKGTHRNWAVVGFSSASIGYALMLLGR